MSQNVEPITQKLNDLLDTLDDFQVAETIFQHFFLEPDPIQFARFLHSLGLPDRVHGELLALKVSIPPAYKSDMSSLLERAAENMWQRIEDRARELDLRMR